MGEDPRITAARIIAEAILRGCTELGIYLVVAAILLGVCLLHSDGCEVSF